ncbi:MAG: hypothetical protein ACOC32_03315 [Nanoarchaeota archaeon]
MKCKVKTFGISAGDHAICFLHSDEARALRIRANDRVLLKTGRKEATAIVDIMNTYHFLKRGEVGISEGLKAQLKVRSGQSVTVLLGEKPHSLSYIKRKLDGKELTDTEFYSLITDILEGNVHDAEIGYFLSACYTNGMSDKEIEAAVLAGIQTGASLKFDRYPFIDLRYPSGESSLAPFIARMITGSLGIPTSGLVDDAVADAASLLCRLSDDPSSFDRFVKANGMIVTSHEASGALPIFSRLRSIELPFHAYPLGLIVAATLAEAKAMHCSHLFLSLPYGRSPALRSRSDAEQLKRMLERMMHRMHIKGDASLVDLGSLATRSYGAPLCAREILSVLKNDAGQSQKLRKESLSLASLAIESLKRRSGDKIAREVLSSGQAYDHFRKICRLQGKRAIVADDVSIPAHKTVIRSKSTGIISDIDESVLERIASAADLFVHKKRLDRVEKNEPLLTLYADGDEPLKRAKEIAKESLGLIVT